MATISIFRKKQKFNFWWQAYQILIDGKHSTYINDNEKIDIEVDDGEHELRIRYYWQLSNVFKFNANHNQTIEVKRNQLFLFLGLILKIFVFCDMVLFISRKDVPEINPYYLFVPQGIIMLIIIPFYLFRYQYQEFVFTKIE